jgi:hypothetical protein
MAPAVHRGSVRLSKPTSWTEKEKRSIVGNVVLGGVLVIMLAIGPKVRGLKPDLEQWIFKGDKNS